MSVTNTSIFWGSAIFILVLFLILPPSSLQIADEKAYYEQGLALSQGSIYLEDDIVAQYADYIPKHYPLGTALFLAPGIAWGGPTGAFWVMVGCWLFALYYAFRGSESHFGSGEAALLILAFPPAIILSRHLMSEMPSLLAITCWGVSTLNVWKRPSITSTFAAGCWAWLALSFRETNLLLTLPWFLYYLLTKRAYWKMVLIGGIVGLAVRLASSALAYGDAFFVKDPGVAFSLAYLFPNLPLYLLGLLVFIPGGLWVAWQYKGPWYLSWHIGLFLYLTTYLCYGYSGNHDGFIKSLILGLRYLIPTLPLFVLYYASYLQRINQRLRYRLKTLYLILVPSFITIGYYIDYQSSEKQLTQRNHLIHQGIDICSSPIWYEYCSNFYD